MGSWGGDYSITSSAWASSNCGTVTPSIFAVLRLMTSSKVVGCWNGSVAWSSEGMAAPRSVRLARSEIGKIGLAITRIDTEPPRLRAQTRRLVRDFAAVSLSLSALAVVLYGLWRGGWLDALLSGIALGMSMLPEEFPLVLTVFMVMGAWRISRARVLTRRVAAIETLRAATVLCTDTTGTLTRTV